MPHENKGLESLLKVWRGETIDRRAIEKDHMPRNMCSSCNFTKFKPEYAASQWNKRSNISYCKACVRRKEVSGTPLECNVCGQWKVREAFCEEQQTSVGKHAGL